MKGLWPGGDTNSASWAQLRNLGSDLNDRDMAPASGSSEDLCFSRVVVSQCPKHRVRFSIASFQILCACHVND